MSSRSPHNLRTGKLLRASVVVSFCMSTVVVGWSPSIASAAPEGTVGSVSVASDTSSFAVGLQESIVDLSTPGGEVRSERAISVRVASDSKASAASGCGGSDVDSFSIGECTRGLTDPKLLEGAGDIVSFDSGPDGTGSVGGVAVIPAATSPTGAVLIATAPQIRPFGKGGSSGPNAIITTDLKGRRVSTQFVPGVVPGPTCWTGWGDGTAKDFRGSTCETPLDRVGETTTPLAATSKMPDVAVGIGDIDRSPDGRQIIATNVHDGHLYVGPVASDGVLTKVESRPSFATTGLWRPYGLSTFNGMTMVTWNEITTSGDSDLVSFAVAVLDWSNDSWRTVVEPATQPSANDSFAFGVVSAAEVDANGDLMVTFLDIHRQSTSQIFQEAISAPVVVLGADGVDHWNNNVAASRRMASYAVDGVPLPSFGRMHPDHVTGDTLVTTIDTLKYYSGGLTWYRPDGGLGGREQLTWRGEGIGGYQSSTRTVDFDRYLNDADLLVKRKGTADARPWVDIYAFGKSNGLGDLESLASTARIGDRVWADVDGNGLQDAGEVSIPGVAIELLDAKGAAIINPATKAPAVVITDAAGRWVAAVDAGVAVQARVAEANWAAGGVFADGGSYAGWVLTKTAAGAAGLDSNADQTSKLILGSGGVTLLAGTLDYSFDVGLMPSKIPAGAQTVRGVVYGDGNATGSRDGSESGAARVTVGLFSGDCATPATDALGRPVSAATTDPSGAFAFTGLASGEYCVAPEKPSGFRATTTEQVKVTVGATAPTPLSFGMFGSPPCVKVTLEVLAPDLTWQDANDVASAAPAPRNGPRRTYRTAVTNCGETPLAQVIVMPGVVGGTPLVLESMVAGQSLVSEMFEGVVPQDIAMATANATDAIASQRATVVDPAYVAFAPVESLPETGSGLKVLMWLAAATVLLGFAARCNGRSLAHRT